jgi:hypothetical protein
MVQAAANYMFVVSHVHTRTIHGLCASIAPHRPVASKPGRWATAPATITWAARSRLPPYPFCRITGSS